MRKQYDIVARPQQAPLVAYMPAQPGKAPLSSQLPSEMAEPSILKPVLRHWWMVVLLALGAVVGASAYLKRVQPLYSSYAKIHIKPTAGDIMQVLGGVEQTNYLATQATIIDSPTILSRVAELDEIKQLKTFQAVKGNITFYLQDLLQVELERKTDLIIISTSSPFPEDSFQIVSSVVKAYQDYCTEAKKGTTQQLIQTYEDRKASADSEAAELWKSIQDFQSKNPLLAAAGEGNNLITDNLRSIEGRLNEAKLASAQAQLTIGEEHRVVKQLKQAEKELAGMYEDNLDRLKRQTDKGGQLVELKNRYLTATDLAKKLGDEIQKLHLMLGGRALVEIEVIDPPHVAESPSFPRRNRVLSVALVLGGLLGAGLALLRERMDGRFHSIEEIQAAIGFPILGVVPAMSGRRTAVARAMTVHLDPRSVVAEAYRTIRTAVYFGAANEYCKTLLITSPDPGDGKTTSASNLAIAIAQTGRTVLLLDADFRKPTQHKNLDIKDSIGLSSVLAGHEPLDRAIQHTGVEGLDILPCGPIPANPSEILNSREFGELIDALAARYDHILFDSPPVNAVTDARILSAVCDATILVLRADKSTRKAGEHARNALITVGARVLGAIVNDAPRSRGYDAYSSGYYYGSPDRAPSAGVIPQRRRLTSTPAPQGKGKEPRENSRRRNIA